MMLRQSQYHTRLAYTLIIICCLLLASCTFEPREPTPLPPPLTTNEHLENAAHKVDRSIIELYDVERAKKPTALEIKAEPYPEPIYPSLSRIVSVDWSGPVEPLLEEMAKLTHYRVKVLGHEPAIPVLVTIESDKITAHELLREARAQVYLRADILIFPDSGVIELHYLD